MVSSGQRWSAVASVCSLMVSNGQCVVSGGQRWPVCAHWWSVMVSVWSAVASVVGGGHCRSVLVSRGW